MLRPTVFPPTGGSVRTLSQDKGASMLHSMKAQKKKTTQRIIDALFDCFDPEELFLGVLCLQELFALAEP